MSNTVGRTTKLGLRRSKRHPRKRGRPPLNSSNGKNMFCFFVIGDLPMHLHFQPLLHKCMQNTALCVSLGEGFFHKLMLKDVIVRNVSLEIKGNGSKTSIFVFHWARAPDLFINKMSVLTVADSTCTAVIFLNILASFLKSVLLFVTH